MIFIDNFDHDAKGEIPKRQGREYDLAVLRSSKKVSCFWITETQARAERITRWVKDGTLITDNKNYHYPWVGVTLVEDKPCTN